MLMVSPSAGRPGKSSEAVLDARKATRRDSRMSSIIEKAAGSDGKVADDGVVGFASGEMAGGVAPLAHFVEVGAGELGGDGADLRQAADGSLVAERELVGTHAGVLVGQRGDGAVEDHDHIGAELSQLLVLAFAEAFAQAHEHKQREDTPGDAEHGEKAAQLVGHDGAEDLPERVRKAAHDNKTAKDSVGLFLYVKNIRQK